MEPPVPWWKVFMDSVKSLHAHGLLFAIYVIVGIAATFETTPHSEGWAIKEEQWRTVSTSVFFPLFLEYTIDDLAWVFPDFVKDSREEVVSHWLIILSLLPSTFLPMWVLGPLSAVTRASLISLGRTVSLFGVISRLEHLNAHFSHLNECHLMVSLYLISESMLLFGSGMPELMLGSALLKGLLIALLLFSANIHKAVYESSTPASFFLADRRYVNGVLLASLSVFVVWDIYLTLHAYLHHDGQVDQRILSHVLFVVLSTVLPCRITRRSLLAAQENSAIMREMSYKKTFVRYISHEVRSPLSTTSLALDCMMDLLHRCGPHTDYAEVLELAQDCKATCSTAIRTLSDLLLYDKVESHMLQLECQGVRCYDFIERCVHPLEKEIKLSGLRWEAAIDDLVHLCEICADQIKMDQVLRNFISNAIKFTPSGGKISLRATVVDVQEHAPLPDNNAVASEKYRSCRVRIEVTDDGPGIAKENLPKLFGQYVQFDANKLQKGGGSGLGLWLSKAIVEAHGGEVGAHSEGLGAGSTFFFEVPGTIVLPVGPSGSHHSAVPEAASAPLSTRTDTAADEAERDELVISCSTSPALSPESSYATLDPVVGAQGEKVALRVLITDDAPLARKIVERVLMTTTIYFDADGRVEPVPSALAASLSRHIASNPATSPILPRRERGMTCDSDGRFWSHQPSANTSPRVPVPAPVDGSVTAVPEGLARFDATIPDFASPTSVLRALRASPSLSHGTTTTGLGPHAAPGSAQSRVTDSPVAFVPTSPGVFVIRGDSEDRIRAYTTVERDFTRRDMSPREPKSIARVFVPPLPPLAHVFSPTRSSAAASGRRLQSLQGPNSARCAGSAPARLGIAVESHTSATTDDSAATCLTGRRMSGRSVSRDSLEISPRDAGSSSSGGGGGGGVCSRLPVVVEHAANGQICVDLMAESMLPGRKPFDVVLVDYYMPVLDGEHAIRRMREGGFGGVVIALTGAGHKDDVTRLLMAGATAVMAKPFDRTVFLQILARHYRLPERPPVAHMEPLLEATDSISRSSSGGARQ